MIRSFIFLQPFQIIPSGNDCQKSQTDVEKQSGDIGIKKCTEVIMMQSKMHSHQNREQNNAQLSEKQNQKPTDNHQRIHTKSVIEKS